MALSFMSASGSVAFSVTFSSAAGMSFTLWAWEKRQLLDYTQKKNCSRQRKLYNLKRNAFLEVCVHLGSWEVPTIQLTNTAGHFAEDMIPLARDMIPIKCPSLYQSKTRHFSRNSRVGFLSVHGLSYTKQDVPIITPSPSKWRCTDNNCRLDNNLTSVNAKTKSLAPTITAPETCIALLGIYM